MKMAIRRTINEQIEYKLAGLPFRIVDKVKAVFEQFRHHGFSNSYSFEKKGREIVIKIKLSNYAIKFKGKNRRD